MDAKRIIIEDALARPEVHIELEYLFRNRKSEDDDGEIRAVAITFLSKAKPGRKEVAAEEIIAQAIVLTFPLDGEKHSYVYEANIRLPRRGRSREPLLNNYLPMARDLHVRVSGLDYYFNGIFFCQQNGSTTFCAHSALKVVAHSAKNERMTALQANRLLGSEGRRDRTTRDDLVRAFNTLGLNAMVYDFTKKPRKAPSDNPWTFLSSAVEAGHPSLLIVHTAEEETAHVLPVIGYTINSDEWHPHASDAYSTLADDFLSSSEWIDHLIINDDVTGPLYCLSQSWLKHTQGLTTSSARTQISRTVKKLRPLIPTAAIAILPAHVDISATLAEKLAHASLRQILPDVNEAISLKSKWWTYLLTENPRHVLRTTIVKKERYLHHLLKMHGRGQKIREDVYQEVFSALPDVFWHCEISLPNLYAGNRAKLGEIFIRPSGRKFTNELETVIGFRLPGVIGWKSQQDFIVAHCGIKSHSRLIGQLATHEW